MGVLVVTLCAMVSVLGKERSMDDVAQALTLAHAIESDPARAPARISEALRTARRPALVAMAWCPRPMKAARALDDGLGDGALADTVRLTLAWKSWTDLRQRPPRDATAVLAARPTGAKAKKVGDMRAWLGEVASVSPDALGPLATELIALTAHPTRSVAMAAERILDDAIHRGSPKTRDALVEALIVAKKGSALIDRAADLGSKPAVAAVAALAKKKNASLALRFRAAWHARDVAGMCVLHEGKPRKVREEAIATAYRLGGRGGDRDAALAKATSALLDDEVEGIRTVALALAAALAQRGVRVTAAIARAAAGLGDETEHERPRIAGAWTVRWHGMTCAELLGAAMASADRARIEKLVRAAMKDGKRARRAHAAHALGRGLRARAAWDEIEPALRETDGEVREALVRGLVGYPSDADALAHAVSTLRAMGIEPTTLAPLAKIPLPAPSELGADAVAVLAGQLGTADRGRAVRAIGDAARRGAKIGPLASVLAGVLLCRDYADPYPFPVLEALALAARREGPSPAAPFLAGLIADRRDDVRAAACEIVARSGVVLENATIDAAALRAIARRPFDAEDVVAITNALPAARHAAEALAAMGGAA